MITKVVYAAIRRDNDANKEWIDINTISSLPNTARDMAELDNQRIERWARANPVQRIAKVMITEIGE